MNNLNKTGKEEIKIIQNNIINGNKVKCGSYSLQ